jgi:hypothetical protein
MGTPAQGRFPPWPDELLDAARKDDAIKWLLQHGVPSRIAAAALQRWGAYVGAELTGADYKRVRRDLPAFPRG